MVLALDGLDVSLGIGTTGLTLGHYGLGLSFALGLTFSAL